MTSHSELRQLRQDNSECEIHTKMGFLQKLKILDSEILYSKDLSETLDFNNSIPLFGMPVLFPFSGRSWSTDDKLGNWTYAGTNFPMPRHGFFHTSIDWKELEQSSTNSLTLVGTPSEEAYRYFPFHYEITQVFTVESRSFRYEIKIQNKEISKSFPIYLGWHPFFEYENSKRNQTLINSAKTYALVNTEGNINESIEHALNDPSFNLNQNLNHVLKELKETRFTIENFSMKKSLKVSWKSRPSLSQICLVLWNNPKNLRYFCVEPWSAPPDAWRNQQSFIVEANKDIYFDLLIEL